MIARWISSAAGRLSAWWRPAPPRPAARLQPFFPSMLPDAPPPDDGREPGEFLKRDR